MVIFGKKQTRDEVYGEGFNEGLRIFKNSILGTCETKKQTREMKKALDFLEEILQR